MNPEIITRYQEILAHIAVLTEEKEAILGLIRETIPAGESQTIGDYQVSISRPQERLNTRVFTQKYPPADFPRFYKPTVDTQAVKAEMAPAYLEKDGLYQHIAGRVTIK